MATKFFSDATRIVLTVDFHKPTGRNLRRAIRLLDRCETVGDYRAAREKRGLGGLGGHFRNLVATGAVELR